MLEHIARRVFLIKPWRVSNCEESVLFAKCHCRHGLYSFLRKESYIVLDRSLLQFLLVIKLKVAIGANTLYTNEVEVAMTSLTFTYARFYDSPLSPQLFRSRVSTVMSTRITSNHIHGKRSMLNISADRVT